MNEDRRPRSGSSRSPVRPTKVRRRGYLLAEPVMPMVFLVCVLDFSRVDFWVFLNLGLIFGCS
ncbi:hypothetical protein HanRHA438_Chr03g0138201 [Helianthus annuus]|nr:hypothetical protein HanIR_Chr03g0138161 [Helianthus annuus]KAJ0937088.1 hypothetical protein HanRHA438_Chr03g0138201 [Helianthus annuus]